MESMDAAIPLPDNIASLKSIVLELFNTLKSKDRLIGQLEHRLDLLLRSRYGSKSEKINPEELLPQLRELFEQPQTSPEAEPAKKDLLRTQGPGARPKRIARKSSPSAENI